MDMPSPVYAEDKERKRYPHLMLSAKEFPPLKDWKVGKTYTVTATLKMTSVHMMDDHHDGEFEVQSLST